MNRHTIKYAIAATLVFACTFAASAAVNRYVNAEIGDDDKYDGSSPTVVSDTVGPKKTLMGALSLAVSGDTVYAAAGVYSNGVYEADGYRYRAHVTGGVKLIGEGPDKTFIVGAKDLEAGHAEGCGPNAVACVYLEYTDASKKGGIIQGFSVSGGRSCVSGSGRAVGIAGNRSENLAVDCVISNNYNVYRGGGVSNLSCSRCVFAGNNRAGGVSRSGTAHAPQNFINCVILPGEAGMYSSDGGFSFYNCTIGCSFDTSREGREVTCKNCIIYKNHATHHYYNCLLLKREAGTAEPDCRDVTEGELDLDENYVPRAGSIAIGGCTNEYYTAAMSTFWNVAALDKEHDVVGSPRQMGGEIDIGAGEYDWRKSFAADFATHNVTVTDVTPNVVETSGKKVSVPVSGSMTVAWSAPAAHEAEELDYRFTAKVTDGATLTVTRGGATLVTATAADGEKTWTFKGTGDQELVFAVTGGNGAAELSDFHNSTLVRITDDQDGVTITGAGRGDNEFLSGELSITLARNYTTEKLCTGVNVNGEFFSFTGADADRIYAKTVAAGDPDLLIEAVYAEHNDWYVDASAPDDNADGRTPYRPKRTLAGAMTNALLASGDTVHAAPGIYREGTMSENATTHVTNRVFITAGVTLVADRGCEVTAIEGFVPETAKRGGTDPIRGVLMETGAVLKGFTVRNSMVAMDRGSGTIYGGAGGGISGGTAVDCVISNCWAVRGGGTASSTLIRCRVIGNHNIANGTKNPAGGSASIAAAGIQGGMLYDSYVTEYAMNLTEARNCTFAGSVGRNGSGSTSVYNCYISSDSGYLRHYNSVLAYSIKAGTSQAKDDNCVTNTLLKFDANLRPDRTDPTTAAFAIDRGNADYYVYPSAAASEAGKDLAGGQRIYNGRIDVGCGEVDWRGDYTRSLSADRRFAVAAATPGVTNAVDGVVLTPEASAVTLSWDGKVAGRATLATVVSGDGALMVMVDGVAVAPDAEGAYAFDLPEGLTKIDVSFAGTGSARLVSFDGPKSGLLLLVR